MRLLNTRTRELEEFTDDREVPPYAILSHTWGEDEVTFDDIKTRPAAAKEKKGYSKILNTCRLASEDDYQYAWIDTCCIDKSSSAELSEAINSMYRWYWNSAICYVHLADSWEQCRSLDDIKHMPSSDGAYCRWFSRGWTLQELIAPRKLRFHNCSWSSIGYLKDNYPVIAEITGIGIHLLRHSATPQDYSIAQRFSWAAHRFTTRVEDQAYSLLGLFDVNMPLLYGEGHKAFVRLQEEIIKSSCDHSILAWHNPLSEYGRGLLFAPSASCFDKSGAIVEIDDIQASSFALTNRGLQIPLRRVFPSGDSSSTLALLNCRYEDDFSHQLALSLSGVGDTHVLDYDQLRNGARWKSRLIEVEIDNRSTADATEKRRPSPPTDQPTTLTISRKRPFGRNIIISQDVKLWIKLGSNCSATALYPRESWNSNTMVFTPKPWYGGIVVEAAAIYLTVNGAYVLVSVAWDYAYYTLSVERRTNWNLYCMERVCSYLKQKIREFYGRSDKFEFAEAGLEFRIKREQLFGETVLILSIDNGIISETLNGASATDNLEECQDDQSMSRITWLTPHGAESASIDLDAWSDPTHEMQMAHCHVGRSTEVLKDEEYGVLSMPGKRCENYVSVK